MTPNERRQLLTQICRPLNIRFRMRPLHFAAGTADERDDVVTVSTLLPNKDTFVSTVIHEVCHILARRDGKYTVYHTARLKKRWTRAELIAYKRTALEAERYVDRMAEKMTKRLFPEVKYHRSYRSQKECNWFRAYSYPWVDRLLRHFE